MSIQGKIYHGDEVKCAGAPMCSDCNEKSKREPFGVQSFFNGELDREGSLNIIEGLTVYQKELDKLHNDILEAQKRIGEPKLTVKEEESTLSESLYDKLLGIIEKEDQKRFNDLVERMKSEREFNF